MAYFEDRARKILKLLQKGRTERLATQVEAIAVNFLSNGRTTQDFRQEQMADEDTVPIVVAKKEGRHPDW